ncbi:MAG: hypothetical protein KDK76_02755 [Chlamydiia bacterium]|nr:hypothetical protein [Chlamydiia bacterium]
MKKLFLILIAAFIGFGGYYVYNHLSKYPNHLSTRHTMKKRIDLKKWITFSPKEEGFAALFPKKPEKVVRDLPIPGEEGSLPYKEFICKTEGEKSFSVSYTTLPEKWLKYGNGLVLGGALKVIMQELGKVELIGKQSATFKSFPALDYEHYNKTTETAGTLILVGNILYKVEMTYPHEKRESAQEELEGFIENFTPTALTPSESLESDTPQSP